MAGSGFGDWTVSVASALIEFSLNYTKLPAKTYTGESKINSANKITSIKDSAHDLLWSTLVLTQLCLADMCWIGDLFHISRINRAWLYKALRDSDWQRNFNSAQLTRHQSRSQKVLYSVPTGGNFFLLRFFNLPCINLCWQRCQLCIT